MALALGPAQKQRDLDAILGWLLSQKAGDAGLRWFRGLGDAIASLATLPERCAFAPENTSLPYDVRQLLYGRRQNRYRYCSPSMATRFSFCMSATDGENHSRFIDFELGTTP